MVNKVNKIYKTKKKSKTTAPLGATNSTKVNDQLSTPTINFNFLFCMRNHASKFSFLVTTLLNFIHKVKHASNTQSKLSFLFTKWSNAFKFYSQSEATLLNSKPWLILYLRNAIEVKFFIHKVTKWSNAFKFYSQSEATLLITKPRLILYLWNHASNTQSKLSFLFTKWSNALKF